MKHRTASDFVVRRAADFAETGEYEVATTKGVKRIYRDADPHVRWLLCNSVDGDHWVGSTKEEAVRRVRELFG